MKPKLVTGDKISRATVLFFIERARAVMEASPHWLFISVDLASKSDFHMEPSGSVIPPAGAPPAVPKLLGGLKQPQEKQDQCIATPPRHMISTQDHIKAFKKAKEKTAAGVSGLHFRMFKAHTHRPHVAALDASMQSVAHATGCSCERWKKELDVQWLKQAKGWKANSPPSSS